jgi:predicted dehydrogenase
MKRMALILSLLALPLAAQEYKVALVGLGHAHVWGHLDRILKGGPARLVGIAETLPLQVAEAKKRGAAVPFYDDYKKMLDELKPDIVWAFVENHRHLEIVETCAPRKIHVIFEKPLASTYKDALAIQRLARQHGIQVLTNYQMVWWPTTYAAKKRADAGEIGPVWRLRGVVGHGGPGKPEGLNRHFFLWLTDPVQNGAGALMDFGCYNALWALWYKGRPLNVYAHADHLRPQEFSKVEDNSVMILSYKDGVGIFESSWDLPHGFQDLEVFGRDGSVYVNSSKVTLKKGRGAAEDIAPEPLGPEMAGPTQYLTDCIRNNKPIEGLVALDINVGVVEIIEAAKLSLSTGKPIALPLR